MFTLEIATGNAAFDDDGGGNSAAEIARILRQVAEQIEHSTPPRNERGGGVFDVNGNRCGNWVWHAD